MCGRRTGSDGGPNRPGSRGAIPFPRGCPFVNPSKKAAGTARTSVSGNPTRLVLQVSGPASGGWVCHVIRDGDFDLPYAGGGTFSGTGFEEVDIDLGDLYDFNRRTLGKRGLAASRFELEFRFYGPNAHALVRIDHAEFLGGFDTTAPRIVANFPRRTRRSVLPITGFVADDTLVFKPQIEVNGESLEIPYFARLQPRLAFRHRAKLKKGANRILLETQDVFDNYRASRIRIRRP